VNRNYFDISIAKNPSICAPCRSMDGTNGLVDDIYCICTEGSICKTCNDGYYKKDNNSKCTLCSDTTKGGVYGCSKCTWDTTNLKVKCSSCNTALFFVQYTDSLQNIWCTLCNNVISASLSQADASKYMDG
jgi:hypothetical protein